MQFVNSNPTNRTDALGLYEDEVDELIDDLTGHKIYTLVQLNEGAKWASLGLNTAAQIALSLIPGYGIYEAYQSVEIIRSGRGGLMDYLSVGLAGFSSGVTAFKAVKLIASAAQWGKRGNRAARTALQFKSFTKANFRHNLKARTGVDPPSNVHAHHVLPDEFADTFAAREINYNDPKFGTWWPGGDHLSAHRNGYNDRWRQFLFRDNPDASASEILEFGQRIGREYGLDIGF